MIDLRAGREGVAAVLRRWGIDHPDVVIYPGAIDGPAQFPLVLLGLPEADLDTAACQTDTITWPLAVAVKRDGISEAATLRQLEDVWTSLLQHLRDHLDDDELVDVGQVRRLTAVEPGDVDLQGTLYPAQVIRMEITG